MEINEYAKMDQLEKNHWWFVAKRKFLRLALARSFGEVQGKKIADIGCGTGAVLQMLVSMGADAEGVDMSDEALRFCMRKNLKVRLGTAENTNFPDASFDAVIISDVLEHLSNDQKGIKEIFRILKPGGICIATVPAHQFLFSYHDKSLHHFRRYSKKEFQVLLNGTFNDVKVSWIHMLILLPAIVSRTIMKFFIKNDRDSDVRESPMAINLLMSVWYVVEYFFFQYAGLPFGLSLIGVAKK